MFLRLWTATRVLLLSNAEAIRGVVSVARPFFGLNSDLEGGA